MAAALKLLAIRGLSEAELMQRLLRKGFSEGEAKEARRRCLDLGYLDDRRFAEERARSLLRSGRGVGQKVLEDLKGRGIDEARALEALEAAGRDYPEKALLAEALERRFPDFRYCRADDRQRRRVVNYFLRRGYSLTPVLSLLKERDER